jgi:hypothetical protein
VPTRSEQSCPLINSEAGAHHEDTFDGRAFAGIFRKLADVTDTSSSWTSPGLCAKDYSAQIIKAKSQVDAILIFGADADCITLFVR